MQSAGLELQGDHPVMAPGSTPWIPTTLALRDRPAARCETPVLVRVRTQLSPVKARGFLAGTSGDEMTQDGWTSVGDSPLLPAGGHPRR